jgi:hypothetical protein
MGYTHYWKIATKFPQDQWTSICADARELIKAFGGLSRAKVNEDGITFHGTCDTFWLSRCPHSSGGYCKTQHEPYDKLVCAVLMVAARHSPDIISIFSDACMGSQPDGWPPAAAWASKVLGYKLDVPWRYTFCGAMRGICYRTIDRLHLLRPAEGIAVKLWCWRLRLRQRLGH